MAAISKGLRFGAIALIALVVLGLLAQVILSRIFSPSYLEKFLEENLTAEAKVEKVSLNLFAGRVTLHGLSLQSNEPKLKSTGISVAQVRMGVKVLPLFSRRLETRSFVIEQPHVQMSLDQGGSLSLAELFRQPGDSENTEIEGGEEERGVLEAEENRWLAKLEETRLEGGTVEMLFEKEKLLLKIEGLDISLDDLQFDPEDLATLNQVKMTLSGNAQLFDSEKQLLVKMDLEGEAAGKLFDEKSGDFEADVLADLALGEDSYLNPQVQIVRRIWGYLDRVEQLGIPLGDLPDRIGFGRSRRIVASYQDDRVTLAKPLSLSAGKWEVGVARDSWIAIENGQHEIGVEFLAGKKVSQTLGGWLDALPKEAQSLAESRFVDEQQVLWRVNSSGDLGDPEFNFFSQLPEAEGLLKELENTLENEVEKLRDKAGGFLKDLLD